MRIFFISKGNCNINATSNYLGENAKSNPEAIYLGAITGYNAEGATLRNTLSDHNTLYAFPDYNNNDDSTCHSYIGGISGCVRGGAFSENIAYQNTITNDGKGKATYSGAVAGLLDSAVTPDRNFAESTLPLAGSGNIDLNSKKASSLSELHGYLDQFVKNSSVWSFSSYEDLPVLPEIYPSAAFYIQKPTNFKGYRTSILDTSSLKVWFSASPYNLPSYIDVTDKAKFIYDFTTLGEQIVTVKFDGYQGDFTIQVAEPGIASMSVVNPGKNSYLLGDSFTNQNLVVAAYKNDGAVVYYANTATETPIITDPVSGTELNDLGTVNVKAVVENAFVNYSITVVDGVLAPRYNSEGVTTGKGLTFTIPVTLTNNPGLISTRFAINYNEDIFELVGVENTGLLNGWTEPASTIKSGYVLRWSDSYADSDNTQNGMIARLTFRVKDDVTMGNYLITIDNLETRNANGDRVTLVSGKSNVIVAQFTVGDVDGDNEITDWDSILLDRYLANWNVNIIMLAADIDGDGSVTDWDSVILARYLAGWNVTFGNQG